MRIARFESVEPVGPGHRPDSRLGAIVDELLIPLPRDTELATLLAATPDERAALLDRARAEAAALPLGDVHLLAPVRPGKCLAVGMNYADHAREFGSDPDRGPAVPTIFTKHVNCIAGPGDAVHLPRVSDALDYEGELVLVIGRRCRHVPRSRALDVVGAWCVGNDVSVRDWQLRTGQFTMGKSFDTHGPIGPWLVTADELGDPAELRVRTWVNDELRQDGNTRDMIFDCATIVAHLSQAMTLEPGDLVFTGTPAGIGGAMTPPCYLKAGDRVRVEITRRGDETLIGRIDNPVIPEPDLAGE